MPKQSMTPEEKAARKAKKAAEEQAAHEEFLMTRERFRSNVPYSVLQLLARAGKHPQIYTKVTQGSHPCSGALNKNYVLVQLWTGDDELDVEFYLWESVAESLFELNSQKWEFEQAVEDFERYEEKLNLAHEKARKRRELIQRLSDEERELLGLQT